MLVLYDNPNSSCALRVRFLLAELGLDYERIEVPMTFPRLASYVELNPLGGIPTLVDGDFVLSESHTILRYLAAREGRVDLYPDTPRERARVNEFLDRFATGLRSELFRHEAAALGYAEGEFHAEARDSQRARDIELELEPTLGLLENLIADNGTVLGAFTIADASIAPPLNRTLTTGLDLTAYPKLSALRETILGRPAWSAAAPGT